MNKYTTTILLKNDLTNEQIKLVISKLQNYINNSGTISKIEDLGLKKLAYDVKKYKEAYFYVIHFENKPESIHHLERLYRITDEVLKFIIIKLDD